MVVAGPFGTFQYGEPFQSIAHSAAAARVIDVSLAPVTVLTLTANVNGAGLSFSNWPGTGRTGTHSLQIVQGGAGGFTITWNAAIDWGTAGAPTLTTTAGQWDIITFFTTDNGTNVSGMVAGQGFS